jgi:hypothetical protein
MSDDLTLVAVGLFQLVFGIYIGWLRWGREARVEDES